MLSSDFHSRQVPIGGERERKESSQNVSRGLCFVGIDPSFTNTGFVALNEGCGIILSRTLQASCPRDWRERTRNIIKLRHELKVAFDLIPWPTCVVMEGHAYGSLFLTYAFGELGFAYQRILLDHNAYIIPPTTIKKFITGYGRADKERVANAIWKEVGLTFSNSHLSDACACALAAMVLSEQVQLGHPEVLDGQRTKLGDDH